jgi:hypothetical protein
MHGHLLLLLLSCRLCCIRTCRESNIDMLECAKIIKGALGKLVRAT